MIDRDTTPTTRQATVLSTLCSYDRKTARGIGVRSDVLWRMEERGWVGRNIHDQWHIKRAGQEALERYEAR